MIPKKLDPDELYLDKAYLVGVLTLVIKRWKNNGTDAKFVLGLKALRFAIKHTPERIFRNFWKQVLIFINELLFENAKAQARTLGETWVDVLEKIPSKIETGDFDLDD